MGYFQKEEKKESPSTHITMSLPLSDGSTGLIKCSSFPILLSSGSSSVPSNIPRHLIHKFSSRLLLRIRGKETRDIG